MDEIDITDINHVKSISDSIELERKFKELQKIESTLQKDINAIANHIKEAIFNGKRQILINFPVQFIALIGLILGFLIGKYDKQSDIE